MGPKGGVCVETVTDLDAHGVADLFQLLARSEQVGPRVRWTLTHLAELGLEVVARDGRPDGLERFPMAVNEKGVLAKGVDIGAVLLVELAHHIV